MKEEIEPKDITKNVDTYLQLCRDRYAEHEDRKKTFSAKSMRLVLFGITLGWIVYRIAGDGIISEILLISIGLCVVSMSIIALLLINIPKAWDHPFQLEAFEGMYSDIEPMSFNASLANTYRKSIDKNTTILARDARYFKAVTIITTVELLLALLLVALS